MVEYVYMLEHVLMSCESGIWVAVRSQRHTSVLLLCYIAGASIRQGSIPVTDDSCCNAYHAMWRACGGSCRNCVVAQWRRQCLVHVHVPSSCQLVLPSWR